MATQENITARQLDLARKALWHQDGNALQTLDSVREWLEGAGMIPVYPHAQFLAPIPSFAEAVLGRPEKGWVPATKNLSEKAPDGSDDDSFAIAVEEDEAEEDFGEEDSEDEDFDDENEPPTAEGNQAMLAGDGNIASDRETMLSGDDEVAEDEGDEIAEEDLIEAQDDLPATDLPPVPEPVNGFSPEERELVSRTLVRLIEDGTVVPLNLLGSTTGEPDYIVPSTAFSFVYTLRGDKNWKNEPATTGPMRVSPLAVKVFGVLKEKGAKAPHQITVELGQGLTDSATLRALSELWAIQRVVPLPGIDGRPAKWELTAAKYLRHMKAGANAGQPTALSALLSLYLAQVLVASTEEMEVFLSPLAARSRVREVVHGLSTTRQLEDLVVDGRTLLHVAGDLPVLPADDAEHVAVAPQRSRYEADDRRAEMEERAKRDAERPDHSSRPGSYPVRKPAGARTDREGSGRPSFSRGDRPSFNRGGRPEFGGAERRPFAPRSGGDSRPFRDPAGDRERRPFQRREDGSGDRPSFARPWDEERASHPRSFSDRGGERRPFTPRDGGERRPYAPREGGRSFGGDRRTFTPREGGERRPFTPRGDGDRRPFTPREGGDSRPFTPRGEGGRSFGGDRRPFAPREGGDRRPYAPREGGRSFDGDRRSFTPREGGERRPFTPRGGGDRPAFGGERRPFVRREGGEGRPSGGGFGRKPFGDAGGFGGPRKPFGDRPRFGGDRPQFDRGARPGFDRPNRDRFSGEAGEGRPSFQSGAHSAGPGGAKFGGSGFGRERGGAPGKFGKPGFKPARKGPGFGPGRGGAPKRRSE